MFPRVKIFGGIKSNNFLLVKEHLTVRVILNCDSFFHMWFSLCASCAG